MRQQKISVIMAFECKIISLLILRGFSHGVYIYIYLTPMCIYIVLLIVVNCLFLKGLTANFKYTKFFQFRILYRGISYVLLILLAGYRLVCYINVISVFLAKITCFAFLNKETSWCLMLIFFIIVTHAVLNAFILDINTRTLPKHVPKGLILGTHIPYYLYVITDSV